ncbi:MAG: hypothetical protein IPI46_13895 [Bacteroidetes bacterium]|nr:hypothetical protein [Bacteroidota bacterium]
MDNLMQRISEYDNQLIELNNLIKTIKVYPKILEPEKDKLIKDRLDSILFLVLHQNDFIIGLKYLELSIVCSNQYEANYFTRVVSLGAYELLQKIGKFIGKELNSNELQNSILLNKEELKEIRTEFNDIKKNSGYLLKTIRNNVIAHKDEDVFVQTELMNKMNHKDLHWIAFRIYRVNYRLIALYSTIVAIK